VFIICTKKYVQQLTGSQFVYSKKKLRNNTLKQYGTNTYMNPIDLQSSFTGMYLTYKVTVLLQTMKNWN
jgi:hypothetical protein